MAVPDYQSVMLPLLEFAQERRKEAAMHDSNCCGRDAENVGHTKVCSLSGSLFLPVLFTAMVGPFVNTSLATAENTQEESTAQRKYDEFLGSLDEGDPSSIAVAAGQYLVLFSRERQVARDHAFVQFLAFYSRLSHSVCDSLLYTDEKTTRAWAAQTVLPPRRIVDGIEYDIYSWGWEKSDSIEADRARIVADPGVVSLLKRNGLLWGNDAEGRWLISHDPGYVPGIFLPHISRSLKEFVLLRSRELPELFEGDGELGTPAPELARRVASWEKYTHDFPNSLLKDQAVYLYKIYLATFIKLDGYHSPDKRTGANGEFALEWYRYVRKHAGTKSAESVEEYLLLLEAHEFSPADWSEGFYKKLDEYLDSLGKGPTTMAFIESLYMPPRE